MSVIQLAGLILVLAFLLVDASPAPAAAPGGAFLYPSNGATNVDTSNPFTWTAVPGAQAYYLYVGTAQGAKDLVDTDHLSAAATSYQVPPLPTGQTLWARIWTELNNVWNYQDVSFTARSASTAYFAYPQSSAPAVDPAVPFSWYAVPNAQQYYLYVGTTQGAHDLVDSGSLAPSTTSYLASGLPTARTLWARIWTVIDNNWTYRDVNFTAGAPSHATFTYPQNGSTAVDTSKGFSWISAPSAQAYYLDIGTSKGAKDVLESGTLSAATTSDPVPALPVGQTLWARLWTEVDGSWAYSQDISFRVSISASRMTYPRSSQTTVDTRKPFTWLAAPDAQAYYLRVGSSPGASDLVDSGATTKTSLSVPSLPIGDTLFARIYTEINGSWSTYTQISFTVAYSPAVLSNPIPGQNSPNQDTTRPFSWTPVPGASAYALWIGTTPGGDDIAESGQLPSSQSSYVPPVLAAGGRLWVRLWTLAGGAWIDSGDVPFTPAARIIAPGQQSIAVDPTRPFSWTPGAVLNGRSPTYELTIGTRPGGSDLFDSGTITATSVTVPPGTLPSGRALYAGVILNLGDGTQRRADTVFAVSGGSIEPSDLNWGTAGSQAVDTSQPFVWDASDLAQAYRLEVSDGSSTVVDSGPIHVSEYFAESVRAGSYTAKLGTELGGTWSWTTSSFTVLSSGSAAANEIAAAHWATNYVRHMADSSGYAYQWSDLWEATNARLPRVTTSCGVYAYELVNILQQMDVAASDSATDQPKTVSLAFTNWGDDHVIVDFWDSEDSDWIVLDPTFDLAMVRAGDGHWATVQDAEAAATTKNWSAITYVPLGDFGFSIAAAYYLDYPLLYLNAPEGNIGSGADPTPYLTAESSWPVTSHGIYVIRSNQSTVQLIIDGQPRSVATNLVDGYSRAFGATSVALPPDTTQQVSLYEINRYVF